MLPPALLVVLALAPLAAFPSAAAQDIGIQRGGCPDDPDKCLYASANVTVGGLSIAIEARVANGSAEVEAEASAQRGDAGELVFAILAPAEANETYNVTIAVNATDGATWTGETTRSLAYAPEPGLPEVLRFGFRVDNDAVGLVALPWTIRVDGDSLSGSHALTVPEQESPGLAAPLALLGVVAVAWAMRRREA